MTSLASQPPAHKPTSLLSLPPELIGLIWSHLKHSQSGMRPICRSLLPFTRRALFDCVYIDVQYRLLEFVGILRPRTSTRIRALRISTHDDLPLGSHIRSLSLPSPDGPEEEQAVKTILISARKVEDLTLSGDTAARILLPWTVGSFHYSNLKELSLDDFDSDKPYDMDFFERLPAQEDQDAHPLFAGFSLSTLAAANFVPPFPNLTALSLTFQDLCELDNLLTAAPSTLRRLEIELIEEVAVELEPGERVDVSAQLSRFTGLKELTLGRNTWPAGLFNIPHKHLTGLTCLSLEYEDPPLVGAPTLINLLRCRFLPNLSRLPLDVFFSYATYRPSKHPDDPAIANGTFNFEKWWALPQWTREFSYGDAKEILRVAKDVGVKAGGSFKEAIRVEELKQKEERYLRDRADGVLLAVAGLFEEEV
ncbi:hypothetical protein JCM8547_001433 [Rhodosporidiobolus lusitaniae]